MKVVVEKKRLNALPKGCGWATFVTSSGRLFLWKFVTSFNSYETSSVFLSHRSNLRQLIHSELHHMWGGEFTGTNILYTRSSRHFTSIYYGAHQMVVMKSMSMLWNHTHLSSM